MTRPAIRPISYDPSGVFLPEWGLTEQQVEDLAPALEAARREVVEVDARLLADPALVPAAKRPLDAAFCPVPERLLDEYARDRDSSELGQILRVATRLREAVDRVVVLGIGGSYMGARALMDACCQPYFNGKKQPDYTCHLCAANRNPPG